MAINPAAISGIILGIIKGLNLGVPSPSEKFSTSFWNVSSPPIPAPHITPILSWFRLDSIIFESSIASEAATIPY